MWSYKTFLNINCHNYKRYSHIDSLNFILPGLIISATTIIFPQTGAHPRVRPPPPWLDVTAFGRWDQTSMWTTFGGHWSLKKEKKTSTKGAIPARRASLSSHLIGLGEAFGWRWNLGAQSAALTAAEPRWRAMPRFTVHIRDEWVAVACRDTSNNIQWLGQEALKRYIKNKPDNGGIQSVKETRFLVRRCQGLGLLDADDIIDDVLEDNDFVELGNDFRLKCKTTLTVHMSIA